MRNIFNRKASDMNAAGEGVDTPPQEDTVSPEGDVLEVPAGTNLGSDAANKLLRLQADFDNFRRRNASARQEGRDEARREMLSSLLGIYDNFLRALNHASEEPEPSSLLGGIEGIRMQFEEFFRREGLEEIPATTGTDFDPNHHEATGTMPTGDGEPNTVAKELLKGFTYKGQVLRPAQVLVYAEA